MSTSSLSLASQQPVSVVATNVRRLMARDGLTFEAVVEATGLDVRTLRGLVHSSNQPHARTLHKLATGLGISIDELFQPLEPSLVQHFDRATNPVVEAVVASHEKIFKDWSESDFEELTSRFGTGGGLTETGVLDAAEAMNHNRALLRQVQIILESSESDLLAGFVKILYRRVTDPVTVHH